MNVHNSYIHHKERNSHQLPRREFYGIVRKHLRSDGILQVWYLKTDGDAATSASVAKALKESFPYVPAFHSVGGSGIHFLASMEPLPLASASDLAARLPRAASADLVEWGPAATAEEQFNKIEAGALPVEKIIGEDADVPALEDDQPIDEYYLLRDWFHYYR